MTIAMLLGNTLISASRRAAWTTARLRVTGPS